MTETHPSTPAPRVCDLVDNDCDESLLDGGEPDFDGDGFPDCADDDVDGDGYTTDTDCDDLDPDVNPGATDTNATEGLDDDCDGSIDEDSVVAALASDAVLIFTEAQVNPFSPPPRTRESGSRPGTPAAHALPRQLDVRELQSEHWDVCVLPRESG